MTETTEPREDSRLGALPEPWYLVDEASAVRLVAELDREVGQGHPLYGRSLRAIARCAGCDNVMFTDDQTWAVVHLTWTKSAPEKPPWPSSTSATSFDQILVEFADHHH